jgi:hypothetical protein
MVKVPAVLIVTKSYLIDLANILRTSGIPHVLTLWLGRLLREIQLKVIYTCLSFVRIKYTLLNNNGLLLGSFPVSFICFISVVMLQLGHAIPIALYPSCRSRRKSCNNKKRLSVKMWYIYINSLFSRWTTMLCVLLRGILVRSFPFLPYGIGASSTLTITAVIGDAFIC